MKNSFRAFVHVLTTLLIATVGFAQEERSSQLSLKEQADHGCYLARRTRTPVRVKPVPSKQQSKGAGKEVASTQHSSKQNTEKSAPKGSHDQNQRESNREKHEAADARRQREQKKAEEKRERSKKG